MKNSIRTRLILVLTGFIVVFIAVNLLMNISFLERFYTHQKTRALGDIYNQVYEVSANIKDDMDYFSDPEIYYALDRLGANNGVTLYLFSITNDGFFNIPKYNFKFPEIGRAHV